MEARELKFFKRYLKEKGLYYAFIKDARMQQDVRLHGRPFQKYIRKMKESTNILMVTVNWTISEYRHWNDIYSDYQLYFNKNYNK
jgi:hypothetical protein